MVKNKLKLIVFSNKKFFFVFFMFFLSFEDGYMVVFVLDYVGLNFFDKYWIYELLLNCWVLVKLIY